MKRLIEDAKVWATGKSLVITIPRKILDKLKISEGDEVNATIEKPYEKYLKEDKK